VVRTLPLTRHEVAQVRPRRELRCSRSRVVVQRRHTLDQKPTGSNVLLKGELSHPRVLRTLLSCSLASVSRTLGSSDPMLLGWPSRKPRPRSTASAVRTSPSDTACSTASTADSASRSMRCSAEDRISRRAGHFLPALKAAGVPRGHIVRTSAYRSDTAARGRSADEGWPRAPRAFEHDAYGGYLKSRFGKSA
jgi:hypothetical protein